MALHDISWFLDADTLAYPGDPPFTRNVLSTIASQGFSMELFTLGSHAGTHLDAPSHIIAGGEPVDGFPLSRLNGRARVLDARRAGDLIGATFLSRQDLVGVERLLLRTANGSLLPETYDEGYVSLSLDGARHLTRETAVRLVGIDYLSIEGGADPTFPVHRTLLTAGIAILEGLDFETEDVVAGDYELICAPLKIRNADGSPCRAFLRDLHDR